MVHHSHLQSKSMQVEILIMLRKPHIQRFDAISTQQPLIDNQYIQIAYYKSHHQPYLQGFELFHSMMRNHFTDSKGVWQPPLYTSPWSGLPPFPSPLRMESMNRNGPTIRIVSTPCPPCKNCTFLRLNLEKHHLSTRQEVKRKNKGVW